MTGTMFQRRKSKEPSSSRRVTPPSPSYMDNGQFGKQADHLNLRAPLLTKLGRSVIPRRSQKQARQQTSRRVHARADGRPNLSAVISR